jgi:hypothetical protein
MSEMAPEKVPNQQLSSRTLKIAEKLLLFAWLETFLLYDNQS